MEYTTKKHSKVTNIADRKLNLAKLSKDLEQKMMDISEEAELNFMIGIFGKGDKVSFCAIVDYDKTPTWTEFDTREKLNHAIKMSYDNIKKGN